MKRRRIFTGIYLGEERWFGCVVFWDSPLECDGSGLSGSIREIALASELIAEGRPGRLVAVSSGSLFGGSIGA